MVRRNLGLPHRLISKNFNCVIWVKKWIPEFGTKYYPKPIVEHKKAREKVLKVYKEALDNLD